MPTVANVPMNQINALPILSVEAASTPPSTVVVTGTGKIIRTWLPATSGINGQSSNVADPRTPAAGAFLITNWLDFTGMASVVLMLGTRVMALGGDSVVDWGVRLIPMVTAGASGVVDPTPVLPGPSTLNLTAGWGNVGGAGAAFPQVGGLHMGALTGLVFPGGPYLKSAVCGWGASTPGAAAGLPVSGVFKLWLLSATGADPAENYLTVIASS